MNRDYLTCLVLGLTWASSGWIRSLNQTVAGSGATQLLPFPFWDDGVCLGTKESKYLNGIAFFFFFSFSLRGIFFGVRLPYSVVDFGVGIVAIFWKIGV